MRVEYSLLPALLSLSKSLLITVTIVSQCFLCFAVSIFYQYVSLCPVCFSPHCVPCVFLCLLCFRVFHCAPCVSLCFSVFHMCPLCLCFTVSLVLRCILPCSLRRNRNVRYVQLFVCCYILLLLLLWLLLFKHKSTSTMQLIICCSSLPTQRLLHHSQNCQYTIGPSIDRHISLSSVGVLKQFLWSVLILFIVEKPLLQSAVETWS